MAEQLNRIAFTTDRTLEFFTESELRTQLGYGRELWPVVLVKELIDNGLDAGEATAVAPVITVTLEADAITVADNGPGISANIIEKSLDYYVRISDKKGYISPTRGQLGNALKCVWAAPFVVTGEGLVEVTACGLHHRNPGRHRQNRPAAADRPYDRAICTKRHFDHGPVGCRS
jgi:DNA topoisomerase VI subunit B